MFCQKYITSGIGKEIFVGFIGWFGLHTDSQSINQTVDSRDTILPGISEN